MLLRPNDVLTLDLDDTLFPEASYVRSGFVAVGRWVREALGREGFFDAAWGPFQAGRRGRVFDEVLESMGIEATPVTIDTMVAAYRHHVPEIDFYPDARRLLDRIPPGTHVALITDGAAISQRRKIEALGLDRWIPTIVVTDELGRDAWKPSTIPFERVAAATGAPPGDHVYVGDNPRKDFVAPNMLGWRSVQVVREGGVHATATDVPPSHKATSCIRSLDEIAWSP